MAISKYSIRSVSSAKGAVLVVLMRWVDRLVGLISTVILARLLVPEDFGIVAMAAVVIGAVDTVLDLGVSSALIQNKDANRDDFDTAWTLRMIQAAVAAAIILLIAPYAGNYFNDQRVPDVIRAMAFLVLIGGFENIGIVAFQKNMEFGRDFRFFFLRRIAGFFLTIALAFYLQSYWAMVIGAIFGRTIGVLISYWLHDFRPKLSLSKVAKLWSFSQWVVVRNMGVYGQGQLDKILIGNRTNASTMGNYALADEIAVLPISELLAPLGRVLFPAFVKVKHDSEQLRNIFRKALGVQSLLAIPAGVGLCIVASDVVMLLLGQKWQSSTPLVQILALVSVATALSHSSGYLLLALGRVGLQAVLAWVQLFIFIILTMTFFEDAGVEGIAYTRLATTGFGLIIIYCMVLHYVEVIRVKDLISQIWRPMVATAFMSAILLWSGLHQMDMNIFTRLLIEVVLGASVYAISLITLWRIVGCPDGAEMYLLEQAKLKNGVVRWLRCT